MSSSGGGAPPRRTSGATRGSISGGGTRNVTRRTVRTVAASGPSKDTPWGVSLKPVPRRVVTEEVIGEAPKDEVKHKSKSVGLKSVKAVLASKKKEQKRENVELQVCLLNLSFSMVI